MVISLGSMLPNMIALGIAVVILALSAFSSNLKERVYFWFFINVACFFTSLLCDIVVETLEGNPGALTGTAMRIFDCLSYSFAGLQIGALALYLYEYLLLRTAIPKKQFLLLSVCGVVIALLSIVFSFMGMFMQLDQHNNYIVQPAAWAALLVFIMMVIPYWVIVLKYIKEFSMREGILLILYAVVPLVCNAVYLVVPDIYLVQLGVSVTMLLIYINMQVDLRHKMRLKEMELTENRVSIMLSQIGPHFLYNSLTSIEYLCVVDGSEQAATAVRDFSKYLRGNMESIAYKGLIPFEKELQHANLYLSLENRRFGDLIQTKYDTPACGFVLPPLTLQPIVENAVRHGVAKREKGGLITIRTEEDESFWRITVTDDGVGFDTEVQRQDGNSHIGIANVRSRLEALLGGQLIIESTPGVGTAATILIPKARQGAASTPPR